ncbi:hypothetical protein SLEP1_g35196 [Rubroshorea leprosula]|uniref:MYB-CC type transcription factor LHEQLE-containing domain-containing protein n=1 Tax=Rubroshorea leprosula TaxID=152421 RepID=A0AAV5KMH1_9ROSI|nr:hypothetical protein SLEP1_g35196 [Rubroshorea leprosula]
MNGVPQLDAKIGLHIREALELQLEIQRRLHEQIQIQRNLQLRIEEQERQLKMIHNQQESLLISRLANQVSIAEDIKVSIAESLGNTTPFPSRSTS